MFANLDGWKLVVLALVAVFVLGPERLPKAISDTRRVLRTVRQMVRDSTDELSRDLGTPVNIEDLHPRVIIRKHLLTEDDEAMLRRPLDDLAGDLVDSSRRIEQASSVPPPTASPAAPEARRTTSRTWDVDSDAT
jgi:sec-independent protein translocase protein TatB